MESNSVCSPLQKIIRVITISDDPQRKSDLFITSMITDRIGRQEVLLPINHKNYNFQEKKNSQVEKERESCIKRLAKEA